MTSTYTDTLAKRALVALQLLLLVSLAGCDPPEVVVGAVRNDRLCKTCFESRRDNPLIQGTLALEVADGQAGTFIEEAERNKLGFLYKNLRVDALVSGDGRLGASELDLIPNPTVEGSWASSSEPPPRLLPWELHGIELGYAITEAVIARQGATGSRSTAPQSPVKVALDRTVMLVPVQVVRVIPNSPDAPYASNLAKFTKAVQKNYWDGRWDIDTARFSAPKIPNEGSVHSVNSSVLPWDSADEIWDQCGIQFRMITCPGSNEGCPDLQVSDPARVAATSCVQGFSPETSGNWTDAEALAGIKRDLPIVIFTWRVTQANCPAAHLAKSGRAAMSFGVTFGAGTGDLTLAHELGHVLGLNDFRDCKGDGRHLMCTQDSEQTRKIRPEDCLKARANAARYVKRQWDVEVTP